MLAVGSLAILTATAPDAVNDFVVMPFRCWNMTGSAIPAPMPYPKQFDRSKLYPEIPNGSIVEIVNTTSQTYYLIKAEHAADIDDSVRTSLKASVSEIAKHPGRHFSVSLLYFGLPCYRSGNYCFLYSLLNAMKDRDRCVIVVESQDRVTHKMVEEIVTELNSATIKIDEEMKEAGMEIDPVPIGEKAEISMNPRIDVFPPVVRNSLKRRISEFPPEVSPNVSLKHVGKRPKIASPDNSIERIPPPVKKGLLTLQEEDLMCIVCYELKEDALTANCCGAVVCRVCLSHITTCPTCRVPVDFQQNTLLKKLVRSATELCVCGKSVAKSEANEHKQTCEHSWTCPSAACRGQRFRAGAVKGHLKEAHGREILTAMSRILPK